MSFLWSVIADSRHLDDHSTDRASLARMAQGDGEAVASLYDRHARAVYSLALRILHDRAEAEDAVQEVFAQAWRQASRYDPSRGAVAAWLLNLTRSRAIDRLRMRQSRPQGTPDERAATSIADSSPLADAQLFSSEQVARVRAALEDLPAPQRIPVELAYFEGLTHSEIAARLEQPLGTVKTRIRLAMITLRDALAGTVS